MNNSSDALSALIPTVYGNSARPPRGDYSRDGLVGSNYTCPQNYAIYTAQDHDTYRRLFARQSALLPGLACDEFIAALPLMGENDQIPRFEDINKRLLPATDWQVVAVPGLIPEVAFLPYCPSENFP